MDEAKTYCVYKHTSPSNKVYIGITSEQNPTKRWGKNGSGYSQNEYFSNAIKKYGWDNFKHEILLKDLTKEEACQQEIELIALFDSTNRDKGYNLAPGGEINIPSEEARKKIAIKTKERLRDPSNHPMYGKHHSEETKKKLSEASGHSSNEVCQKLSEVARERLSNPENHPLFGTHLKQEHINLLKQARVDKLSVAVLQYDMDNNLIAEYKSATEAASSIGVHKSSIAGCCQGKYRTIAGFIWRYKDKDYNLNNKQVRVNQLKPVLQFDMIGNVIAEFPSLSEAIRSTGIMTIAKCCQGKTKSAGGFVWKYKSDYETQQNDCND